LLLESISIISCLAGVFRLFTFQIFANIVKLSFFSVIHMDHPTDYIAVFIIVIIIYGIVLYRKTFRKHPAVPEIALHQLLTMHVAFYRSLPAARKQEFVARINSFLADVNIINVDRQPVNELDRALVGASAIIPIFNFPGWKYNNISEVLLYPDRFNTSYQTQGELRNILGMVGTGHLHHSMLLSRPALREGFRPEATTNTGIHEFVHLIDMADGSTDGVPGFLIPRELVRPWMEILYATIQQIKDNDSGIRPYAAVNEAEFLSVVSEYFFTRPQDLRNEHPALYEMLEKIYNPAPAQKK